MAAAVINNTNTNPIPDSPLNPIISNVNTPTSTNPTNKPGINKIPKIPNAQSLGFLLHKSDQKLVHRFYI